MLFCGYFLVKENGIFGRMGLFLRKDDLLPSKRRISVSFSCPLLHSVDHQSISRFILIEVLFLLGRSCHDFQQDFLQSYCHDVLTHAL